MNQGKINAFLVFFSFCEWIEYSTRFGTATVPRMPRKLQFVKRVIYCQDYSKVQKNTPATDSCFLLPTSICEWKWENYDWEDYRFGSAQQEEGWFDHQSTCLKYDVVQLFFFFQTPGVIIDNWAPPMLWSFMGLEGLQLKRSSSKLHLLPSWVGSLLIILSVHPSIHPSIQQSI